MQNGACGATYSSAASIEVVADPTVSASGTTTTCSGSSTTLIGSGSGGTGTGSYQWQSWNGSTWNNIGGATGSTYNAAPTSTTDYRVLYNTSGTNCTQAASNTVTVTVDATSVYVPFSGNNSVSCGSNITLKDHKCDGNYDNFANGYTVLNNANSGVITISGSYAMESCCDRLRIYSGSAGSSGTLLQEYGSTGTGSVSFTSAPGQTVSVVFTSDVSIVNTGFSLSVTYSGSCTGYPVPYSGSNSYNCGTNITLEDHAGGGNYDNYANGYSVLNNAGSSVITITGTYAMEACCDRLRIFSGTVGSAGTLLQEYGSAGTGTVSFTGSVGEPISVLFYSDLSIVNSGFSLNVAYSGSCCTSVAPTSVSVTSNPICLGSSTTLTLNGGSLGTGAAWQWYSGSCGGTPVGSGTSITVSPTSTTTYYVRGEGGCVNSACTATTVTVNAPSVGGTVSPASQTICASEGIVTQHTLSGHTGSVVYWEFAVPGGGFQYWGGEGSTTSPGNCCFTSVGTWRVRALVQNGVCAAVYSSEANIFVVADPTGIGERYSHHLLGRQHHFNG